MKKIIKISIFAFVCLFLFSCSLDSKMVGTWTSTKEYSVYNSETSKYDRYTANIELSLDNSLSGTFKILPEHCTDVYKQVDINVVGTMKEIENTSKGYYEDWLICTDGTSILEFKVEECLNPQPTHYELRLEDATWGPIDLVQKK